MKATRETPPPPAFIPVVLALESQAEIDALYAIFNFTAICVAVREVTGDKPDLPADFRAALLMYTSQDGRTAIHTALKKRLINP